MSDEGGISGETAAAAGCKPRSRRERREEALRQMPPFRCALTGAGMNKKWAIPGTR